METELRNPDVWIEVLTRMEMDDDGIVSWLDSDKWRAKRERLAKLGGRSVR